MFKKLRRKTFLVFPRLQLTLATINFSVLFGGVFFLGLYARSSFAHIEQVGLKMHLYKGHPFYQLVEAQAHDFYSKLFLGFIVAAFVSSVVTIFLSHKLVGPLIRLQRYLDQLERADVPGTIEPMRVRRQDFTASLTASLNRSLHFLLAKPEN